MDEARAIRGDVEGLVNQALEQNPGDAPFMIFIDVNVPSIGGVPVHERVWFRDVWELMESLGESKPTRPDESNAIVFTNFAYHWEGRKPARGGQYIYIVGRHPRYPLPEEVLGRILSAVTSYGDVPGQL